MTELGVVNIKHDKSKVILLALFSSDSLHRLAVLLFHERTRKCVLSLSIIAFVSNFHRLHGLPLPRREMNASGQGKTLG